MNTKLTTFIAALCTTVFLLATTSACTTPTVDPANRPATFDALISDLKAAGAQVEMAETNQDPFFSAPGQTIKVNGKSVTVYEYPDETARKAESETISADGFGVGTTKIDWVDQPHFWASHRIIVLYVGKDQATLDLLNQRLGDPLAQPE